MPRSRPLAVARPCARCGAGDGVADAGLPTAGARSCPGSRARPVRSRDRAAPPARRPRRPGGAGAAPGRNTSTISQQQRRGRVDGRRGGLAVAQPRRRRGGPARPGGAARAGRGSARRRVRRRVDSSNIYLSNFTRTLYKRLIGLNGSVDFYKSNIRIINVDNIPSGFVIIKCRLEYIDNVMLSLYFVNYPLIILPISGTIKQLKKKYKNF